MSSHTTLWAPLEKQSCTPDGIAIFSLARHVILSVSEILRPPARLAKHLRAIASPTNAFGHVLTISAPRTLFCLKKQPSQGCLDTETTARNTQSLQEMFAWLTVRAHFGFAVKLE